MYLLSLPPMQVGVSQSPELEFGLIPQPSFLREVRTAIAAQKISYLPPTVTSVAAIARSPLLPDDFPEGSASGTTRGG